MISITLLVSHLISSMQPIITVVMLKYRRNLNCIVPLLELIPSSTDVARGSMMIDGSSIVFILTIDHHHHQIPTPSITITITVSQTSNITIATTQLDIISPSMDALTHIWTPAFASTADVSLSGAIGA